MNHPGACGQIHKQLQSFLDDMLSEEEYRLFLDHLDECPRCMPYVKSIGDLSNQIWKLGSVAVPADFKATVLFEAGRPAAAQEYKTAGRGAKKIVLSGGVLLALVLAFFLIKPAIFNTDRFIQAISQAPMAFVSFIDEQSDPALKQSIEAPPPVSISSMERPADAPKQSGEASAPAAVVLPDKPAVSAGPISQPAVIQPKHWHLTYYSKNEQVADSEKVQRGQLKLQTLAARRQTLNSELKRLEEESRPGLGRAYSGGNAKTQSTENSERDAALGTYIMDIQEIDAETKRIEDENSRIERRQREEAAEKKRKDALIRSKIVDTLVVLDAKFQYQDPVFLVFSVPAEKMDHALENILPVFQQAGEFRDFGDSLSGPAGQEQQVSIYLDRGKSSALHWHVGSASSEQKIKLYENIRELGGTQEYESEGMAVVSVPKTKVKELGVRVKAMRIQLTEFGNPATEGELLSNVPIKISIYFSK